MNAHTHLPINVHTHTNTQSVWGKDVEVIPWSGFEANGPPMHVSHTHTHAHTTKQSVDSKTELYGKKDLKRRSHWVNVHDPVRGLSVLFGICIQNPDHKYKGPSTEYTTLTRRDRRPSALERIITRMFSTNDSTLISGEVAEHVLFIRAIRCFYVPQRHPRVAPTQRDASQGYHGTAAFRRAAE